MQNPTSKIMDCEQMNNEDPCQYGATIAAGLPDPLMTEFKEDLRACKAVIASGR